MTTISKPTASQIKYIRGLCKHNEDVKKQAVLSISNGRTHSITDLSQQEACQLISKLKGNKNTPSVPKHLQFDRSNSKHKYIISLCHQLEWTKPSEKYGTIADLQKLHNWLIGPRSPVKMCLMDIPYIHLSKIIHALEQILEKQ